MPFRKQRPEVAPGIEQMHPRWERILRGDRRSSPATGSIWPFPPAGTAGSSHDACGSSSAARAARAGNVPDPSLTEKESNRPSAT